MDALWTDDFFRPARFVAAFINHQGGTLLIGVSDEGEPLGLRLDIRKGSSPVYTTNSARGGPPVEKIYVRSGNSC